MPNPRSSAPDPRLDSLLETLKLLLAQARADEIAIPPGNVQARNAITRLRELAEQAYNEADDLASVPANGPAPDAHPFSRRQYEVLTLAAQGLTNKEIAYRLGLSERTVQFHLNEVFNKSGTCSRTEAVALAYRNGWL